MCEMHFLSHMGQFLSSCRGSFLALSAAGHAGGPPVHHGASVGSGRAPWRVLWASRELASNHGIPFRRARAEHDNVKTPTRKIEEQQQQQMAFTSSVLCIPARTSPGRLGTSHLDRGQFAPRPSSRARTVTLRAPFLVPRCICVCTIVYSKMTHEKKTHKNSGVIGFASGTLLLLDPFIEG